MRKSVSTRGAAGFAGAGTGLCTTGLGATSETATASSTRGSSANCRAGSTVGASRGAATGGGAATGRRCGYGWRCGRGRGRRRDGNDRDDGKTDWHGLGRGRGAREAQLGPRLHPHLEGRGLHPDLFHAHLGQLATARRHRGQRHRGHPLLLLDEGRELLLDVAPRGVDLLDLLEDGDRLGREPLAGVLVGQGNEDRDGLALLLGQHQDVRELHLRPRVGLALLQDLDGLGVVLLGDEGEDVVVLRRPEAECHASLVPPFEQGEPTARRPGCQRREPATTSLAPGLGAATMPPFLDGRREGAR